MIKEPENLSFLEGIIDSVDEELFFMALGEEGELKKFILRLSDICYIVSQEYRKKHSLPHQKDYTSHLYSPGFLGVYQEVIQKLREPKYALEG